MKKSLFVVVCGVLSVGFLFSQSTDRLSFMLAPSVEVPLGPGLDSNQGDAPYSIGGAATFKGDYDFGDPRGLFGRAAVGYSYLPIDDGELGETDDLSILSLGAGIGYDLPFGGAERFSLRLSGTGGVYQAILGTETASNLHASAGTAATFALSPTFSLGAEVEYRRYFAGSSSDGLPPFLYDGVSVGIGGSYRLGGSQRKSLLEVIEIQVDPVYPILQSYYDSNPIGHVVVQNKERGDIENIAVSFYVPEYMDSPKVSPLVASLERGETEEIPLYALFTNDILSITEDGRRVNAQIQVSYSIRGSDLETGNSETAVVQNRNALTWTEDEKAAAFVTAKDNTVLRLSKQVAGVVREQGSNALDENFRTAVGIYEALGLLGMQYVIDPDSSYIELSGNAMAQDYVQFPAQTLDYGAGDCDDLSILYMALLESVNVETAFITIPGHLYTAFALSLPPEEARRAFDDPEEFIVRDGKAWVPIEATVMDQGFQRAWEIGVRQWKEHSRTQEAELIPVRRAWQKYSPVPSPLGDPGIAVPDSSRVAQSYSASLNRVVELQIQGRVARLQRQIRESGGNPAITNRLGVLYARYGLLDRAAGVFRELAEDRGYGPAMVNMGNVSFLQAQYARALRYFAMAAEALDNDTTAQLGIARAQYELENYSEAERSFSRVARVDPELAGRFPHLGDATDAGARASAAANKGPAIWED